VAVKSGEKVIFQSGCALWNSQVRQGISEIEKGEYDDEFKWGAKEYEESPKHNNGMHPTAHPPALISGNRSGAAGDAWR
jgi:hypothetical protein